MEGVGARLGRSSTRYGPTTVFTGPVRKWKKKWVPLSSSNVNTPSQSNGNNGPNGSHLLLYKWTPMSQSNNNTNSVDNGVKENVPTMTEEKPRKKFRYVPVYVLEEEKKEDEAKNTVDTNPSESNATKNDDPIEKTDVNDMPMEEAQVTNYQAGLKDSGGTSLDLNLGLRAHEGGHHRSSER